jgi:hypothetical protein
MADLSVLYPNVTDCFQLEKQIQVIKNDMDWYYSNLNPREGDRRKELLVIKQQQFNLLKCPEKVNLKRQADTMAIFDKFASISETRIVTDSKKNRNILIAISGVTLAITLFIILKSKK